MSDGSPFAPPGSNAPTRSSILPAAPPTVPTSHPQSIAPAAAPQTWSAAPQYVPYGQQLVTDQRPANGAVVAIAWICTVLTLGYMLPWAIAATRGKSNQAAVGLINFFLGWSLIGWIVALVMACQAHQVAGVAHHNTTVIVAQQFHQPGAQPPTPAGWYPVPTGGRRYWDGSGWTDHHAP